ncbi:MAG: phasin family protein [Rhodospirillales bacterium]|nr:TIGR01841 family phasin [Rhodospirillales bacterium]MDE2198640.1 phasin family protein [Rhodospirillales bacterium]
MSKGSKADAPFTPPFSGALEQARHAAEDFTRRFAELKLPGAPDMEKVLAAQKRNMEAFSAANRIALEGAQAVAKRHMEIMQQTMTEMTETMRALASTEAPQAKAAQQAEMLKRAYAHAVANTKELSDLIQHANGEALALLNQRFAEAMDEVKALMGPGKG